MHAKVSEAWIHRPCPRDDGATLLCFPHAGGGPSLFNHWADRLAPEIEVAAIRLPGREQRIRERPISDWPTLLDALADTFLEELPGPLALFGHSLGAMIAYELTHRLVAAGRSPETLVLAGCRAPHIPSFLPHLSHLPLDELLARLRGIGATPSELLATPKLLELLEPMMRADLALAESWPPSPPRPVTVPLVVLAATEDPIAPRAAVREWCRYARSDFSSHVLDGDHFFVRTAGSEILELLRDRLTLLTGS